MSTLINGCSFSRGPISWPYAISSIDPTQLTNLALAGAGNTYIYESTVSELARQSYDTVLIMWSGVNRVDLQVSNPDHFSNSAYTSQYQYKKNDWDGKIVFPINDQDYVQKNWIFGCGHINQEKFLVDTKVFDSIYRYMGFDQFLQSFMIKLISLQSVLKQTDTPYLFTFLDKSYEKFNCFPDLNKMIDYDNLFIEQNLREISKEQNSFDSDGIHPGVVANQIWADLVNEKLINR
jgi:hypothetical protein